MRFSHCAALWLFIAIIFSASRASGALQFVAPDWVQVNDGAFGMGVGGDSSYAAEEGFEVLVFKDQMYLGMEADNLYGARLWRTRSGVLRPEGQFDWEEAAADAQGNPFGVPQKEQADHIDSLQEFNGWIYASTANRTGSPMGTRIFRSLTGASGSWQDALTAYGPGFGDLKNENFKDMQVFNGQLCGGTANAAVGAQVWCTPDGVTWSQMNQSGFGAPQNDLIASAGVFSGSLYIGVQNQVAGGGVWRTPDLAHWTQVFTATDRPRVEILEPVGGQLYIAAGAADGRNAGAPSVRFYRSRSGAPGTWSETGQEAAAASAHNTRTIVDGAALFNGALFVAVMNADTGVQLWRTYGEGWTDLTAGAEGFGDRNNFGAELIPFNGYLYAWTSNYVTGQQARRSNYPEARYVIVMIGDGQGARQVEAARRYLGRPLVFESWAAYWMSTYPAGGEYDPAQAWTDFGYVLKNPTDSAAAATAMFSGVKTADGRINVSADGTTRLFSIADKARRLARGVGAASSVYLSHATPGAWLAHNDWRGNGFAIASEELWGDPLAIGAPALHPAFGGGHGLSLPAADVALGAGHPQWALQAAGNVYITQTMLTRLRAESAGAFTFVERIPGEAAGARLLQASAAASTTRLAGLFGGAGGSLEYRLADRRGANLEEPNLAEMTRASLAVLAHRPEGFVLMVEGGAIDWAAHANQMDAMLGEEIDFNAAVQAVIDWVDDPASPATWQNTLIIVTGDHETGYLTAAPGVFADQALGEVVSTTIRLEKPVVGGAGRASWDDQNGDGRIDPGERVFWAWNSTGHTNSLAPLYAYGVGADRFGDFLAGVDPRRGSYLDNTALFQVVDRVTFNALPASVRYSLRLPYLAR